MYAYLHAVSKKLSRSTRSRFSLLLALTLFSAGCVSVPPPAGQPRDRHNLKVFDAAWKTVRDRYYDAALHGVDWNAENAKARPVAAGAPDDAALYKTINDMLASLNDSHTGALSPEEAKQWRGRELPRTGLDLTKVEEEWIVEEILPGGPADRGGVQPGWLVIAQNGAPFSEKTPPPALGEKVRWRFRLPDGSLRDVDLVAEFLPDEMPPIARILPGGIAILRFDEFHTESGRWFSAAMKKCKDTSGIILDLRNNSGGEITWLTRVAAEFFETTQPLGVFVSRKNRPWPLRTKQSNSSKYSGNLVILVDESSASAAEILAAVFQENRRAHIIGRPTAGAVLASEMRRLPDGGLIQISRENYLTPTGKRLEGQGVSPDIKIKRTIRELAAGRDMDVEAALSWLLSQSNRS